MEQSVLCIYAFKPGFQDCLPYEAKYKFTDKKTLGPASVSELY
jgi:hypothetical protein